MKFTVHRLRVGAAANDQRLDQYLAAALPELSRTQLRKIIDLGGVHLDGRRIRSCSTRLKAGANLEIYQDHLPLEPYRIREEEVIFQDQYLIVLDKPAFIDTQPTHARYKGTLYEALLQHLADPFRRHQKPSLGMVQRLDRGTSGLIVFSIHPRAHRRLTEAISGQEVEKRYLALVAGLLQPEAGEIVSRLARTRKENRVRSVAAGGKEAITRYQTRERWQNVSLVEIELLTGRSHQIRAHMAEQGCPLLGDQRYGGPVSWTGRSLPRPCLHSASLKFRHPVSGEPLDFQVPLPDDMTQLIASLAGAPTPG